MSENIKMKKIEVSIVAYETVEIEVPENFETESIFKTEYANKVWEKALEVQPEWAVDYEDFYASQSQK